MLKHCPSVPSTTHHPPLPFDKLTIEGILHGYSDADWAGQTDDRRSTSGYVFFVAGGPVSWQSKTQKSVALSTAEAEYMALSDASKEALHLRALLVSIIGKLYSVCLWD